MPEDQVQNHLLSYSDKIISDILILKGKQIEHYHALFDIIKILPQNIKKDIFNKLLDIENKSYQKIMNIFEVQLQTIIGGKNDNIISN